MDVKNIVIELQSLADKQGNKNNRYGDTKKEIEIFGILAKAKLDSQDITNDEFEKIIGFERTNLIDNSQKEVVKNTKITTSKTFLGYEYNKETKDAVEFMSSKRYKWIVVPDNAEFNGHGKTDNPLKPLQLLAKYSNSNSPEITKYELDKLLHELDEFCAENTNSIAHCWYGGGRSQWTADGGLQMFKKIIARLSDKASAGGNTITREEIVSCCEEYITKLMGTTNGRRFKIYTKDSNGELQEVKIKYTGNNYEIG